MLITIFSVLLLAISCLPCIAVRKQNSSSKRNWHNVSHNTPLPLPLHGPTKDSYDNVIQPISGSNSSSKPSERIIMCTLTSELNDMLCEVKFCLDYAIKYGRSLVINDSRASNVFGYHILDLCNITHPLVTFQSQRNLRIDLMAKKTFHQLSENHNETEIHARSVLGGKTPFGLLPYMKFTDKVIGVFRERYKRIPKPYVSVHLSASYRLGNLSSFIREYDKVLSAKSFFLVSDNSSVLHLFHEKYKSNMYNFSYIVAHNTDDKVLTDIHHNVQRQVTNNIDTLVDLLLLAHGSSFICSDCLSGYSLLAKHMSMNRNYLPHCIKEPPLPPPLPLAPVSSAAANVATQISMITFGSPGNYTAAGQRLINQAKSTNLFTSVKLYSNADLITSEDFWNQHGDFIQKKKRGFGYWIWKPYLIKRTMEAMRNGDILLYLDCGCEIDKRKSDEISKYFEYVKTDLIIGTTTIFVEKKWVKMDLVAHLGLTKSSFLETPQRQAGVLLIYVCDRTREFVNMWYETASIYHLIDDSPSIAPNIRGFREHRHDQSIFSLLSKKYGPFSNRSLIESIEIKRNKSGISKIAANATNVTNVEKLAKVSKVTNVTNVAKVAKVTNITKIVANVNKVATNVTKLRY